MQTQSILGPNGTPMVELGGERALWTRTKGDIVCSFQWLDIGGEAPEACMCLFAAGRHVQPSAYVIPQRNAYRFVSTKGYATPHALSAAFVAAADMGFFPDRSTVHRIVDTIVDGIADLIRMPSEQPESLHVARAVLGIEASSTLNGRTLTQEVL